MLPDYLSIFQHWDARSHFAESYVLIVLEKIDVQINHGFVLSY